MEQGRKRAILDVAHVTSRGKSYRITLPRKVADTIQIDGEDEILVFFKDPDGTVTLEKMKK